MRQQMIKVLLFLSALAITLFYSNCSEVSFENLEKQPSSLGIPDDSSGLGEPDSPIIPPPVVVDPPPVVNPPPDDIICGGTLDGSSCNEGYTQGKGLIGQLFYYPGTYSNSAISHDVNLLVEGELTLAAPIFFEQVFVPTLQFSLGFPYKEGYFTKPNGEKLVEGFAIELLTDFVLRPDQEEGDYEFALLSDDGATLVDLETETTLVDNNGLHSTTLACGSKVNLKKDKAKPLRLRYYQGPKTEIAFTLLMRKKFPGQSTIHCGHASTYDYFYPSNTAKTQGQPPNLVDYKFGDLIEAGWEVPTADNFLQPIPPSP